MEHRICSNCNGNIALQNFLTHEAYCTRSLVKCSVCDELIRRSKLEEHLAEEHATVHCERCSEPYDKYDETKHKDCCSMRPVNCEFCDLVLPMITMPEHSSQCGCRTELCSQCKKFVMIREKNSHACSLRPPVDRSDETRTESNANLDSDFDMALRLQCLELDGTAANMAAAVINSFPVYDSSFCHQTENSEKKCKSDIVSQTSNPPSSSVPTDVIIPCEICNGSYQISEISIHQAQCCRVQTPVSPNGLPKLPSEYETDCSEPLISNRFASTTNSTAQRMISVTNSGDTPQTQKPVCLSRPGKISELRPLKLAQRHPFNGLGEGTSTQSSITRSNRAAVRHPTTRAAYDLPPVKDPKIQRRKFSLSKTENSLIRSPPSCINSNLPKITPRPRNLPGCPKRNGLQVCENDTTRTSVMNPLRSAGSEHTSGKFCTTNPPRQCFPGTGRRLGDH